ncbi:hypothetical protein T06_7756 [Trichinella sp. T6]|nr:hypothetical protein T06_7756 [Trichinella sp. T6]
MEEISCLKGIFLNRRVIKTVLLTKKQNDRQPATLIVQWNIGMFMFFGESCKPTLQEGMNNVDKFSLLKSGPYNGTDVNSVSCSADCLRQAIMIKRTAKRVMYFTADAQLSTKNGRCKVE